MIDIERVKQYVNNSEKAKEVMFHIAKRKKKNKSIFDITRFMRILHKQRVNVANEDVIAVFQLLQECNIGNILDLNAKRILFHTKENLIMLASNVLDARNVFPRKNNESSRSKRTNAAIITIKNDHILIVRKGNVSIETYSVKDAVNVVQMLM